MSDLRTGDGGSTKKNGKPTGTTGGDPPDRLPVSVVMFGGEWPNYHSLPKASKREEKANPGLNDLTLSEVVK